MAKYEAELRDYADSDEIDSLHIDTREYRAWAQQIRAAGIEINVRGALAKLSDYEKQAKRIDDIYTLRGRVWCRAPSKRS